MDLQSTYFVNVDNKKRRLFKFIKKPTGDVYIIFDGLKIGYSSTNEEVKELRLSVHVTKNSPQYNQLKGTLRWGGNPKRELPSLFDAVKMKSGHAPLFFCKLSDLKNEKHNFIKSSNEFAHSMGRYQPKREAILLVFFVCSLDEEAPSKISDFDITSVDFPDFRLLVGLAKLPLPAMHFFCGMKMITVNPNMTETEEIKADLREMMRGIPLPKCIGMCDLLTNSVLERYVVELRKSGLSQVENFIYSHINPLYRFHSEGDSCRVLIAAPSELNN